MLWSQYSLLGEHIILLSKVSISVFTLLAMTLERHKAIMTPLAPRKSHKTLWVIDFTTAFKLLFKTISIFFWLSFFLSSESSSQTKYHFLDYPFLPPGGNLSDLGGRWSCCSTSTNLLNALHQTGWFANTWPPKVAQYFKSNLINASYQTRQFANTWSQKVEHHFKSNLINAIHQTYQTRQFGNTWPQKVGHHF